MVFFCYNDNGDSMYTTVYLIRHSEPFKVHRGIELTNESFIIKNQKTPLSINGEKRAEAYSLNEEFRNIDSIWSSSYTRTMSTAKYFAFNNNIKVNVDETFNERIHGVDDINDLPDNFEIKQFNDENYKIGYGESRKEVENRLYNGLLRILKEYKGKRVIIVGHSTAFMYLLGNFCDVQYDGEYRFKGNIIFNGKWNILETFKLTFDENNELVDINNVKNEGSELSGHI